MENCSTNMDIHQGMGTTQDERFLKALHTHYFLVDERSNIDYIEFAQNLSQFIKFYNESNIEQGDWSTFFHWESTSILVNLFLWDINKIQEDYKAVKGTIKLFQDSDNNVVQETCKATIKAFFEKLKIQFEKFYSKISQLDDSIVAKSYLLDTAYLILNSDSSSGVGSVGVLTSILNDIDESTTTQNPIKALISKYQFDKNVQKLIGLLFNWKQISGESITNQLQNYSSHSPHYALFLAFLKQLGVAQEYLNQFTKRHLDFYYKDILRVKPAEAQPDYVHLILDPVAQTDNAFLPKNSVFLAGKNSLEKNKFYTSTSDLSINKIQLVHFNSTYFTSGERNQSDFMKLNATNNSFNVFKDESTNTEEGILIASSLLFLNGGERFIMITINGEDIDTSKYRFYITAENKCIEIFAKDMKNIPSDLNQKQDLNRLYLYIGADEKKIVAYNPLIHKEINVTTPYPVLKIVPIDDDEQILKIEKLELEVKVRNCKNFVLATDTGTVDINKPFIPFGEFPKKGNGFVFCCNEFASKNNARLLLKINKESDVNSFKDLDLKILKLDKGLWVNTNDDNDSIDKSIINNFPNTSFGMEDAIPTIESVSGYFRFELNSDSYKDEAFLNDFITKIRDGGTLQPVPKIDTIVFDYDVKDSTSNDSNYNSIQVYQILPFGYQILNNETGFNTYENDLDINGGNIYLGFDKVAVGDSLNLLFQLSEGSSNPLKSAPILEWNYLIDENNWKTIEISEIGDETNGLLQSGLINFTIPKYDTSRTTILPSNKFWIKIHVNEIDAVCEFIGVHTQALKAVLTDFENNGNYFIESTEKETITKLYEPLSFVKKVTQPYTSFGGKVKENDELLYQRTSERLRHKNRAITSWDYERLILQKFPNVFRIKCLNHYHYGSSVTPVSKTSAGYITLIPIGKSNSLQENISWKPLVSQDTIEKIKKFVSEIGSPHARVIIRQPKLETIVLKFKVKYHEIPGADLRYFGTKLKNLINSYLSPWSFGKNEVEFANSIEIASIIQLIDDQSFVDFISDFEVNHYYINDDGTLGSQLNVKKIVPHSDYTLFVPPTLFSFPKLIKGKRLPLFTKDHSITLISDTK